MLYTMLTIAAKFLLRFTLRCIFVILPCFRRALVCFRHYNTIGFYANFSHNTIATDTSLLVVADGSSSNNSSGSSNVPAPRVRKWPGVCLTPHDTTELQAK